MHCTHDVADDSSTYVQLSTLAFEGWPGLRMPTSSRGSACFDLYVVYSCDVVTQLPRDTMTKVGCCQLHF